MEVTKRFLLFLDELDNPKVRDQFSSIELQEQLQLVKKKLSLLDIDSIGRKNSRQVSLNDFHTLENHITESCIAMYRDLKKTITQLCLMHVHLTNFPLDSFNITKFLNVYCQTIFGSSKISLLSENFKVPFFLKLINGEQSRNEAQHKELVDEMVAYMENDDMKALNLEAMPRLGEYLKELDYLGNIAIKMGKDCTPFYLILHFTHDSPFTGYLISGKHYKTNPLVLSVIKDIISIVMNKTFNAKKNIILQAIEALKIEVIELQKNYFLSFIASEVQNALLCDMPTSITFEEEEMKPPKRSDSNFSSASNARSVEIVLHQHNRLEIRANFTWDNIQLNSKLSALWGKIQKLSKLQEVRSYYHNQLKSTNYVSLHFSKKRGLIYQSDILPEQYQEFVEIGNFLLSPNSRSMNVVLGKDEGLLKTIQSILKGFEVSKFPVLVRTIDYGTMSFNLVGKKNQWKKVVDGFCVSFVKPVRGPRRQATGSLENILSDLEKTGGKASKRLQGSVRKMKLFLGQQQPSQNTDMLGDEMDINKLRMTIVSEYLPEEITSATEAHGQNKAISAVRKIKIDMTPKTAFRQLGDKQGQNKAAAMLKMCTGDIKKKKEQFTKDFLVTERKDMENLLNWSFDISALGDWMEKSRFVWVILRDMNLISEYNINLDALCEFIVQIKDGYGSKNNPYHNYDHGVSVMHATYYIMKRISTRFSSLVNLGLLISAFCHDVDHSGKNNTFEVNSGSDLALLYHDKSVLEQHHAAVTFQILNKESCNIFSGVKPEDYKELRKLIIANILATDMKEHFDFMKAFRELTVRTKAIEDDNFNFNNDDIKILNGAIIHCADLSGATKDFELSFKWSIKVNEEFTQQMREETALGISVTPYFKDLDKKHIMAKQEIAFISFMVKPLWELFNDFCGGAMQVATDNIEQNLKRWNLKLEDALKELENEKKEQERLVPEEVESKNDLSEEESNK